MSSTYATNTPALLGAFATLVAIYVVGVLVSRTWLHPLRHIPGPRVRAISRIPNAYAMLTGTTAECVMQLHEQYGEVVRVSPNEISFTSIETAWPQIYGFRTGEMKGHVTNLKDNAWFPPPPDGSPRNMMSATDENHARLRRVMSHAFSGQALADQEVLIQSYVDLLITRIKDVTTGSTPNSTVNLVDWYNWATFDLTSDLMFGASLGGLRDASTHEYVQLIMSAIEGFAVAYIIAYWPMMKYIGDMFFGAMLRERERYFQWIGEKTKERCDRETQRPDFMTYILRHNGQDGAKISQGELISNVEFLMVAGTETTATTLSAVTFLLLRNPDVMQKLKEEVRGRWKTYDQITLEEVNKAPYLIAVLTEALRYMPPVPTGFYRVVCQPEGETISGYYIPKGTSVCVSSYPAHHSKRNFTDPDAFIPERWLNDPRFKDDKLSSMQPFSFGPRNCLGKNLAYAEMRLVLAKMIWSFDMELSPKAENWIKECKVFTLWKKPELAVHVKEVVRA